MRHPIDDVLITLPIKSCYGQIQQTIALCERLGVRAAYLADVFQSSLARPTLEETGGFPVMRMHMVTDDHRLVVKRAIDIVVAGVGLLVLSPVLLAIAVAIKLTTPGPAIFGQERFGHNKRRFKMFKFRTMVVNAEALQPMLESRNEATGGTGLGLTLVKAIAEGHGGTVSLENRSEGGLRARMCLPREAAAA